MLISASSWSSGLCPMVILFSRICCLSLQSVSVGALTGPLESVPRIFRSGGAGPGWRRRVWMARHPCVQEILGIFVSLSYRKSKPAGGGLRRVTSFPIR